MALTEAQLLALLPDNVSRDISPADVREIVLRMFLHFNEVGNPHQTSAAQVGAIPVGEKTSPGGVATLGADGRVPMAQLPAARASGLATLDAATRLPRAQLRIPWPVVLDRYEGRPDAGATLSRVRVAVPFTLPAGLAGAFGAADVAATASATVALRRNGGVTGATATYAAGATVPAFAAATPVSFAAGDLLAFTAPDPQDATLAGITLTLLGEALPT